MELTGHIENGVVVFDGGTPPPEGTRVTVVPEEKPVHPKINFPLVSTGEPGSWNLTNDMIADILEEEDVQALKDQWNVSS
jgi:hypothetical protein